MNKCRLQGDPASLLRFKAVGLNKFGVAVCGKRGADPRYPDHYRWGIASMRDADGHDLSISETVAAVNEILAAPARVYNFMIW